VILGAPLAVAPSLYTIPGSSAPTPALYEQEEPPPPPPLSLEAGHLDIPLHPEDGSQRSSISFLPIPGSYFPLPPSPIPGHYHSSGNSTLNERPRPSPLNIPSSTPEKPVFSFHPEQGPSRSESRGKERNLSLPLKPPFSLTPPVIRRRRREGSADSSADEEASSVGIWTVEVTRESSDSSKSSRIPKTGRRRASTISHPITEPPTPLAQNRRVSLAMAMTPTRSLKVFRRRRASISIGPAEAEHQAKAMPHWPAMATQEARRISPTAANQLPFSYQQPADSEYTIESVSTVATVRPLSTPAISPRASSLAAALEAHAQNRGAIVLGLSDVPGSPSDRSIEVVIPDDMVMPHNPPPRRSSLDYGSRVIFELKPSFEPDLPSAIIAHTDVRSILSSSLTNTETSLSADAYSPSPSSSKDHPLSSATTSLSRSAKSGKEGSDEMDRELSAVRLQRSLEWEARQIRQRRRLEKRRMILLELVETEVAYAQDLKTLVQVYLPQLYALPSVSERTADFIARNSAALLQFHVQLAGKMVDVLKKEGLGYESQPELFMAGKLERISRRLASLFVDQVSDGPLDRADVRLPVLRNTRSTVQVRSRLQRLSATL